MRKECQRVAVTHRRKSFHSFPGDFAPQSLILPAAKEVAVDHSRAAPRPAMTSASRPNSSPKK
jgi:hypothetical protein